MRLAVAMLILTAGTAAAAPVPRDPLPDPLGRGYLGIQFADAGLGIAEVVPGTPADKAGLMAGDVFTRVGPVEPRERTQMQYLLAGLRPGSVVLVTVRRGDQEKALVIRLGTRPADLGALPPQPPP